MSTNQSLVLLNEMATFVKVVESESFSETARQLGTTPSAVSRAIARLERALGTRLLYRTTRKLRLSESGQQVLSTLFRYGKCGTSSHGKFRSISC